MLISSFQNKQLEAFIRPGLSHLLSEAIEKKDHETSSFVLQAFVDTWPVASIIETAEQRWRQECDPLSLAVLSRGREILTLLSSTVPELELPRSLPPHLMIPGESLASRRGELCSEAAKGRLFGVVFTTEVPLSADAQLALGELRMEAVAQTATDRYGLPGLLAPDAPLFEETLGHAPSGKPGPSLKRMCDIAELPGTPLRLKNGDFSPVGWLLWNGPAKPLPVAHSAFQLVRHVHLGVESAAEEAGLGTDEAWGMINELIKLGALSA